MSSPTPTDAPDAPPAKKGGKKKLILLALPVLLAAIGAGLWFSGIAPKLLGMNKKPKVEQVAETKAPAEPVFADLPEIIANLNAPPRHQSFIKLKARVELAKPQDQAALTAAMPRILDIFQTYLREMRPEEMRGSAGTYRLREELIARANIAAAPASITDVLFTEMLIQ